MDSEGKEKAEISLSLYTSKKGPRISKNRELETVGNTIMDSEGKEKAEKAEPKEDVSQLNPSSKRQKQSVSSRELDQPQNPTTNVNPEAELGETDTGPPSVKGGKTVKDSKGKEKEEGAKSKEGVTQGQTLSSKNPHLELEVSTVSEIEQSDKSIVGRSGEDEEGPSKRQELSDDQTETPATDAIQETGFRGSLLPTATEVGKNIGSVHCVKRISQPIPEFKPDKLLFELKVSTVVRERLLVDKRLVVPKEKVRSFGISAETDTMEMLWLTDAENKDWKIQIIFDFSQHMLVLDEEFVNHYNWEVGDAIRFYQPIQPLHSKRHFLIEIAEVTDPSQSRTTVDDGRFKKFSEEVAKRFNDATHFLVKFSFLENLVKELSAYKRKKRKFEKRGNTRPDKEQKIRQMERQLAVKETEVTIVVNKLLPEAPAKIHINDINGYLAFKELWNNGYKGSICLFKSTDVQILDKLLLDASNNNILVEVPYFLGTYNPVEEKFNPRRIDVQDIVEKPKVTEDTTKDPTSLTGKEVGRERLGFDHWTSFNK